LTRTDAWLAPPPPAGDAVAAGTPPTFAVVICAYQGAELIDDALRSALDQRHPAAEVIVVDDGSTDDLAGAVEPYLDRITFLRKPNGGIGSAKNAAARHATADFLVFLDQDDAWLPERLEALAELASARPDLDLLTTDAWLERDGEVVGRWYGHFVVDDQRLSILRKNFLFSHVAVRRDRFLEIGGSDESLRIEDWDCWIRLFLTGSAAGCVFEPLARYRLRPDSVSADDERRRRNDLIVLEKALAGNDLTDEERAVVAAAVDARRRTVSLFDLKDRIVAGTVSRRELVEVARNGSHRAGVRAQAAAAAVAPGLAASWLRRR
jgi:glycosyltransferase involved in cell wall biosynthesis